MALALFRIDDRGTHRTRRPANQSSLCVIALTNYHVVAQDKVDRLFDEIYLSLADDSPTRSGPRRYRLKGALMNPAQDLALLRIVADAQGVPVDPPANFAALGLGDARSLKLLDTIIIIGYPEKGGTTITVSHGVVQ